MSPAMHRHAFVRGVLLALLVLLFQQPPGKAGASSIDLGLKARLVSKVQPKEDKLAFNLNLVA